VKISTIRTGASALAISTATLTSAATVDFNFLQTSSGVEVEGSGAFDLSGLTPQETSDFEGPGAISPENRTVVVGESDLLDLYYIESFVSFSSGENRLFYASSGTGDVFGTNSFVSVNIVAVPAGYVSGESLYGTLSFYGDTFETLGIDPENFSFTVADTTVNFNFEIAAVPLPAAGMLLLAAIGGFGAVSRRKRSTMVA